MKSILSLPFVLLVLAACQTAGIGTMPRRASAVDTAHVEFTGTYDNHEQVWTARTAAAIAPPHVLITLESTAREDWTMWRIHYDGATALDALWAMHRSETREGGLMLTPQRALVSDPRTGSAFDPTQWTPLDACALRGRAAVNESQVAADAATCTAIVPGIGPSAALLPLSIKHQGEWMRVRLYADQARGADAHEDARRVETYTGWAAINGSGPQGAGSGDDWHMNRSLQLGSEGGRAPLTWRDGKPSGYSLGLERLTYREGNIPVLKLSIIDDANGAALAYAWANPEATRIGINLGWLQVGLQRGGAAPSAAHQSTDRARAAGAGSAHH